MTTPEALAARAEIEKQRTPPMPKTPDEYRMRDLLPELSSKKYEAATATALAWFASIMAGIVPLMIATKISQWLILPALIALAIGSCAVAWQLMKERPKGWYLVRMGLNTMILKWDGKDWWWNGEPDQWCVDPANPDFEVIRECDEPQDEYDGYFCGYLREGNTE